MSFQDPPGSRYVAGGGEDASASSGRYTSSASVAATSVSTQTPQRAAAATSGTAATSPRNLKYPSRREKDSEREQSIAILGAPTAPSQKSRPLLHHRYAPTASATAAAATTATRSSTAASLSYKDQKRAAQPLDDFELSETVIVENYPTSHSTLEPLPSQSSRNNGAAATNATSAARGSFALPSASPNTSTIFMDERSFLSVGTGMEGQQAFPTALHELDASVAVARTIGGARKFGGAGDRDSQSLTLTRPDPDSLVYSATTAADTNFHSNVSDLTGWDDSQKQSSEPPDIPPPQHIQTRAFSDSLLMRKHPYAAAAASSPSRKKGGRGKKGNIPLPSTMSEREDYPVLVGLDPDTLSQSSSIPPPSSSSSRRDQPKKPPAQMRSGRVQFILDTNYNEDMDDDNEQEPTKQTTTVAAGPTNQEYMDEEGQQAGSIALDQNASTDGLSQRLGLPSMPPPPPSSDALLNHDRKDDDAEFATQTRKRRVQVGIAVVVVVAVAIIAIGVLVYAAPWRSNSESPSASDSQAASNMMNTPAAPTTPSQTTESANASPSLAPPSVSSSTGPPPTIPTTGPLAAPMPVSSTAALTPSPIEPMQPSAPTAPPTMPPPMDSMTYTTTLTPVELGPSPGDGETLTTMTPADHSAIPPSSNTPAPMIPSTFLPTAIPSTRAPMDASPSYIPTTSFSPTKSFQPTTTLYPTITPDPTEYPPPPSSSVSGPGDVANSPTAEVPTERDNQMSGGLPELAPVP
jgi:hypothetical protein